MHGQSQTHTARRGVHGLRRDAAATACGRRRAASARGGLGAAHAVQRGADNPAGVTRALAAGE